MALYDDIPPVGAVDAGGLPGVRALRALFRKVAPTAPVTPSGRVSLADRLFAEDRHRVDLARMDLPATTGRSRSADLLDAVEGAVKWSDGPNGVEMNAIFLAPNPITRDNLNVVIDAGWVSKDVVCQGVAAGTVAACD